MQLASLMSPERGESKQEAAANYNDNISIPHSSFRKGSEYLGAREDEEDKGAES